MSKRLTWSGLVLAEPALRDLERDVRSHRRHPDPDFCANAAWYGYDSRPSLKDRLCELVGWSRRARERRHLNPLRGRTSFTGAGLFGPEWSAHEAAEQTAREEDRVTGKAMLWTSAAYDVAYEHLYQLLPDCRGDCACTVTMRALLGTDVGGGSGEGGD